MNPRRLLILLVVALLAASCSTPAPKPPPRPAGAQFADLHPADPADLRGGTLTLAVAGWPSSFNPWNATAAATETAAEVLAPTRGGAVRASEDGGWQVDEDYAQSVEVVATDPLTVEVRLNPEAVWQDGSRIEAADLSAFVEAVRRPESAAVAHPAYGLVEEVRPAADGTSYQVVFSRPTADWPAAVYPPLPRSVSEDPQRFTEGFGEAAVPSNGPFLVETIDRDTGRIELVRNPRWWGAEPLLDRIVWRVAEPEVLARAYDAEELDAMRLDPATVDVADPGERRYGVDEAWAQITFNGGSGPLRDAPVRRALAAAIDRQAIARAMADSVEGGTEAMGSVTLLPGQRGVAGAAPSRDIAEARRLLDAEGWVGGEDGVRSREGQRLELRFPVPQGDATVRELAELVAGQLAEAGVAVRIEQVPAEGFQSNVIVPLAFDLVGFTWRASAFPIEAATARLTPADANRNFTGIATEPVTEALTTARAELDPERFLEAVAVADAAAAEQASIIPIAPLPVTMAVDPQLRNFGPSTFAPVDWTIVGWEAEG